TFFQMPHRGFGQKEIGEYVGAKCPLQLLGTDLFDRILWMLLGRVVDHDVEPTELAQCLIDNLGAEFLVADVPVDKQTFPTLLFDKLLGFFRVSMLFEIDNADVRALFGEGNSASETDPAVAASYDCDFVLQFAASALA